MSVGGLVSSTFSTHDEIDASTPPRRIARQTVGIKGRKTCVREPKRKSSENHGHRCSTAQAAGPSCEADHGGTSLEVETLDVVGLWGMFGWCLVFTGLGHKLTRSRIVHGHRLPSRAVPYLDSCAPASRAGLFRATLCALSNLLLYFWIQRSSYR